MLSVMYVYINGYVSLCIFVSMNVYMPACTNLSIHEVYVRRLACPACKCPFIEGTSDSLDGIPIFNQLYVPLGSQHLW